MEHTVTIHPMTNASYRKLDYAFFYHSIMGWTKIYCKNVNPNDVSIYEKWFTMNG